ncbi:hypothetical protein DPMN_012761 [Dreissena polymorpha]|uniref:Uncharacterized protein n=1 Tax=Dreissena polymorpha TaxID=45954 RepID=A0A9D4S1Q4_DREPO|nr:hypothetical protein DPMN_012761 [Dreissena polymorpha]
MLGSGPMSMSRQYLGLLPESEFQQVHLSLQLGVCDVPGWDAGYANRGPVQGTVISVSL